MEWIYTQTKVIGQVRVSPDDAKEKKIYKMIYFFTQLVQAQT
jgi:hypothetical protein